MALNLYILPFIFYLSVEALQSQTAQSDSVMVQPFPSLYEIDTILSLIVLSVLGGFAQAGGLGGGPIISPIMMVLLGFDQRKAVWNTYVMMFGGSVGSYLKLRTERVKSSGAPLINYKLVLVTMPLLLAGAIIGVTTGRALPKIFVAVLLFAVLVSVIIKTMKMYNKIKACEDSNLKSGSSEIDLWIELNYSPKQENSNELTAYSYQQKYVLKPSDVDFKNEIRLDQIQLTSLTSEIIFKSPQLLQIYEEEKILYPKKIILNLLLQVFIVLFITFLKGSQVIQSFASIQYCSFQYHLCTILLFCVGLGSITYYKNIFRLEEVQKEKLNYDFTRENKMNDLINQTVKASFLAGFLGGFVGLGGGTILTPLWLEMGVPASRATASATACVMFTSFISLVQIIFVGGYSLDEFICLAVASCIGSYVIAGFLKSLVLKYKRDSIMVLILLGVVALALFIVPIKAYLDIMKNPADSFLFHRFC